MPNFFRGENQCVAGRNQCRPSAIQFSRLVCKRQRGSMKRFKRRASHLPTAGQRVKLGSDSTQRFVILGAQMVQAMLVAVLVDEQSNHLFSNPLLEPFSTQAQLVEHQLTGWPIGSCSQMMWPWR